MRRVRRIAVLIAIPATIVYAAASDASVTVTPGARVSDDRLVRAAGVTGVVHQAEPELAVDPGDATHLLGCAQGGRLARGGAPAHPVCRSADSGHSRAPGAAPRTARTT